MCDIFQFIRLPCFTFNFCVIIEYIKQTSEQKRNGPTGRMSDSSAKWGGNWSDSGHWRL